MQVHASLAAHMKPVPRARMANSGSLSSKLDDKGSQNPNNAHLLAFRNKHCAQATSLLENENFTRGTSNPDSHGCGGGLIPQAAGQGESQPVLSALKTQMHTTVAGWKESFFDIQTPSWQENSLQEKTSRSKYSAVYRNELISSLTEKVD